MSGVNIEALIAALPRLMARVDRREWDACWPWSGPVDRYGYGQAKVAQLCTGAHRLIWQAANETILATNEFCCHACDNPACCNPRHIWIGTHAANIADCMYKGRGRNGFGPTTRKDSRAFPIARRQSGVCPNGHLIAGENAANWAGNGGPRCRQCHREKNAASKRKAYWLKKNSGAPPSHFGGRNGGAGDPHASAPIPAPVSQSSDDLLSQHTNANRTFHGGGIR